MALDERGRPRRAVGLSYKHGQDKAPHVVAKAEGLLAEDLIRVAEENKIPIREDKGLVDTLLRLDYMQEIPEELYSVVAEILVFAYQIMGKDLD